MAKIVRQADVWQEFVQKVDELTKSDVDNHGQGARPIRTGLPVKMTNARDTELARRIDKATRKD